jgi:tetratricopeptide (TPR) repeat protein
MKSVPPDPVGDLFQRGMALYDLRQYPEAEAQLRRALAHSPQHALAHAYLALSLLNQSTAASPRLEKLQEALREARKAAASAPDQAFSLYVLAWACLTNDKENEALEAAQSGMRLEPEQAWGFWIHSAVYLGRSEWQSALRSAEAGLRLDPQHVGLLNNRSYALIMLDRLPEAEGSLRAVLALDPNSDTAHTHQGWLALYQNDRTAALGHFREALRLDPQSEAARRGFLKAMQARNPLYNLLLRYSLFTSRLSREGALTFTLGLSGLDYLLHSLARAFFLFYLIYWPFSVLYSIFAFFTWTADAFFYLLLSLSRSGRLLLAKDEKSAGAAFGVCMLLLLGNIVGMLVHWAWGFAAGAVLALLMMQPVAGIFKLSPQAKGRRAFLVVLVTWLGITAACAQTGAFLMQPWAVVVLVFFLLGWITFPWIANLLMLVE